MAKKLTLFFILGLLSVLIGLIFAVVAFNSVSAVDGLAGIYALFGLIPVIIIIILDRICVWKFGPKKVNKVQFYIAGIFILLFILNWIRLQLQ
ncbi:hypothetical protein EG359_11650 [Chryseobacterium joostei]|uniref:Uncharacterized protein n=1 Tax=Chryseobacterium joostei TaxID=112234 RepID=A0A1N7IH70_9FLAO|nr:MULTISPECIES: hypothetical protein [Chryseobacterium]AZB00239.1 hypothetical protein EG359_11650 [Chryseobacterium joostei]SIS36410.1 hypothetical protein SAMN05421768_105254 [Chryseobacterium joostei]HCM34716.1 hypothetical protein [Chryseobacterium sp.]